MKLPKPAERIVREVPQLHIPICAGNASFFLLLSLFPLAILLLTILQYIPVTKNDLLALIDKKLDKGTKRVTLHLPYDKAGALDSLYREAKVESVEYAATVDVVAVCNPRLLGQLKDYIEGWRPPKEEWE